MEEAEKECEAAGVFIHFYPLPTPSSKRSAGLSSSLKVSSSFHRSIIYTQIVFFINAYDVTTPFAATTASSTATSTLASPVAPSATTASSAANFWFLKKDPIEVKQKKHKDTCQ